MKLAIALIVWAFAAPELGGAQIPPATFPKQADLGVAGITLNFRKSSEDVLGEDISLIDLDAKSEAFECANQGGTEELQLLHHKSRGKNSFQEFRVRLVERVAGHPAGTSSVSSSAPSSEAVSSATSTTEELAASASSDAGSGKLRIKGEKRCVLALEHFVSSREVRLGMSLSEITQKFGSGFRVDTQGSATVLEYALENNLSSGFLKYYEALSYYGRYYFKHGRLIEYHFGLDNL